jgi:hypothetical protein
MEGIANPGTGSRLRRLLTYTILTVGLLAIGAGLWKAHESRFDDLAHLPSADATLASIDVDVIRQAGLLKLLAGKPEAEEPEYLSFIRSTGFDYQKDLESVTAAFTADGTYFIVRGHFDWPKLESFAKSSGGACYERLCHLPGSVPERRISFLPLRPNIMALAVSSDDLAAARLRDERPAPAPNTTAAMKDPVWISIPAAALSRSAAMAPALQLFAATVAGADRVTLTLGPKPGGDFAAKLEAICNNAKTAQTILSQLTQVTKALKSSATFQQSNQKVFGYLPIRKQDFENLAGGI